MTQVIYVKGYQKIDRIYHRYLANKRRWLVKQMNPKKLYKHANRIIARNMIEQQNDEFDLNLYDP